MEQLPVLTVTSFSRNHEKQVNTWGLVLLLLHLPVFLLIAYVLHGSLLVPLVAGLVLLAGPAAGLLQDPTARTNSIVMAIAAMGIAALGIYVSQGRIEAHFSIFVLLALLLVYGRMTPLLVAGATIALHHVLFWLWLPAGVFNYQASFLLVLVHALFVILEVGPCCFIAREFGRSIEARGIVLEHLDDSSDRVACSSQQISAAGSRFADSARQQAETLEKTAAASVHWGQTSSQNAQASESALLLMTAMDQELGQANADVLVMAGVVNDMVASGKKIGEVVRLIDGIAFQTKILSLNAAVEAATAGQHGASFSVVAQEVGSLAQRSASAATDTAMLIDASICSSRTGEVAAAALIAAMKRVNQTALTIKTQLALLESTSRTQQQYGSQIQHSVTSLENVARGSAASAVESAQAAVILSEEAATLKSIVTMLQH